MKRNLTVVFAGMLAVSAFAQNPAGTTAEHSAVIDTKPQARAQAKVAAKPAGQVKTGAGGDINRTPEGGAIGIDKAALAGEQRAETRDARRPAKDGSVKRKSSQGSTPK